MKTPNLHQNSMSWPLMIRILKNGLVPRKITLKVGGLITVNLFI